jgi:hypothetical protein
VSSSSLVILIALVTLIHVAAFVVMIVIRVRCPLTTAWAAPALM